MGNNTLTSRVDGNLIPASDHNELVQALLIDLVPRNNARAPEDIIGSLGTSVLRWLRAYVDQYYIGDAANTLRIYEGASGEIWIERKSNSDEVIKIKDGEIQFLIEGDIKFKIDDEGFEGSYARTRSISYDSMTNTKRIVVGSVLVEDDLSGGETLSTLNLTVRSGFKYIVSITMSNYAGGGQQWGFALSADGSLLRNFGSFGEGTAVLEAPKTITWIYTATADEVVTFRWYVTAAGAGDGVNGGQASIREV